MKNCKEIENNLPLYLDNLLSGMDKQAIEEHLKSCLNCAKVLAQLRETGKLVNGLGEVEPPPWFKQKIMAKVRDEAGKRSFVQKLFYPLRIKIPAQVFATIFIAVLAVYIYRAGEDQMKAVVTSSTPAPIMEIQKNQLPEQSQKASDTVATTVAREKVATIKDRRDEEVAKHDVSSGAAPPETEELKKALPQKSVRELAADAAKGVNEQIGNDVIKDKYAGAPTAKSFEQSGVELERKKERYSLDTATKVSRAPQAQSLKPELTFLLRVDDIDNAADEVEKLLIKYAVKDITRKMSQGNAIFTAELKVQNKKDLTARLKTIGRVEEKNMPVYNSERNITVVIEILHN